MLALFVRKLMMSSVISLTKFHVWRTKFLQQSLQKRKVFCSSFSIYKSYEWACEWTLFLYVEYRMPDNGILAFNNCGKFYYSPEDIHILPSNRIFYANFNIYFGFASAFISTPISHFANVRQTLNNSIMKKKIDSTIAFQSIFYGLPTIILHLWMIWYRVQVPHPKKNSISKCCWLNSFKNCILKVLWFKNIVHPFLRCSFFFLVDLSCFQTEPKGRFYPILSPPPLKWCIFAM